MTQKTVIANFKSNKNGTEMNLWMDRFAKALPNSNRNTVILCPPFPFVPEVAEHLRKMHEKSFHLGVQDISMFPAGSYTGAVGAHNLEDLSVAYAIVGHSERRRYFHETDNDVANKVRESLLASITPIVCVTKDTILSQAHTIEAHDKKKIIVAFEPVENIGTGIADTLEDILSTRKLVKEAFGDVPYIYGGSVDPHSDPDLLKHPDIDGFLVGSASLDPHVFVELLHLVA